ncbi:MAG: T9SS type A sorting domain-containing protein [Bacteroidales bacterium]|nr:T9SS type A sorting domain-containing protein [Bacteroidales bacterium]
MKKFFLLVTLCLACIASTAQPGYYIPITTDTLYNRVPNYYYSSWYDTCDCYYDSNNMWEILARPSYSPWHCGSILYKQTISEPMPITGIAVMVIRHWSDVYPRRPLNTWYACEPEYAMLWEPTDSLPHLLDSVRWDTAAPKLMILPLHGVLDTHSCCLIYEARFKDPIWVNTDFFISTTGNSGDWVQDTANNLIIFNGEKVQYCVLHVGKGNLSCCQVNPTYTLDGTNGVMRFYTDPLLHMLWGGGFAMTDSKWRLDALSCDTAMGSVRGGGTFYNNTLDTLWAVPETGFRFAGWDDGNTDNPRTVQLTQDTVLTACFSIGDPIPHYIVEARTENSLKGTVSGSGIYDSNEVATISATANSHYVFDHWNDGDTANPRNIVVVSDTAFTAYFVGESQESIAEAESARITLSPNPTSGKVKVSASEPMRQAAVYDMAGKEVFSAKAVVPKTEWDLDLSSLPSGTYIVKITTKSRTATRKLIVE